MIDLNDYLPEEKLKKEDLLKYYSEYDIIKFYIGDFKLGETFRSPIRKGDDYPSFNIFYSKRHNCLLFKDFAGKRGDFVILIQELLGIPSYNETIQRIAQDLDCLGSRKITKKPIKLEKESKVEYNIQITVRDWEQRDFDYWKQYGISLPTLKLFNVVPISGYYHNHYYITTNDIAYAYLEYKDKILTYKIYRPTAHKHKKWRNNNPFGVHQGYRQLPNTDDILIITKSLKDVMAIYENLSIPSIGVQSETCFIKQSVIDEYKFRFDRVITLFDRDKQGIEQAASYEKLYDIPSIFIPEKYEVKDFSDLIKQVGKYNAVETLKNLLI